MQHPNDIQLQAFMDGELPDRAARRIYAHVHQCTACRSMLDAWEQLAAAVRYAEPRTDAFSSEGEFWSRLVVGLPRARPEAWPWMLYLPPFLLGSLGTVVQVLVSAAFTLYAPVRLGLIPPLGPMIADRLSPLLRHPVLQDTLYAWLGWSVDEVAGDLLQRWSHLSRASQDAAVILTVLFVLGALLSLVIALYFSWVWCWERPAGLDRKGGR